MPRKPSAKWNVTDLLLQGWTEHAWGSLRQEQLQLLHCICVRESSFHTIQILTLIQQCANDQQV